MAECGSREVDSWSAARDDRARPGWQPPRLPDIPLSMSNFPRPSAAIPADLPRDVRLQIVSTCPEIPDGEGWLHEIKHDGHRLVAIVGPDKLTLLSRNGYDRTALVPRTTPSARRAVADGARRRDCSPGRPRCDPYRRVERGHIRAPPRPARIFRLRPT